MQDNSKYLYHINGKSQAFKKNKLRNAIKFKTDALKKEKSGFMSGNYERQRAGVRRATVGILTEGRVLNVRNRGKMTSVARITPALCRSLKRKKNQSQWLSNFTQSQIYIENSFN